MGRWGRRVDANHGEVVEAFRRLGFAVADLSRLGSGIPDLAISRAGRTALIEVKDGDKPPSARKLTPDEQRFRDGWQGAYHVVCGLDDVEFLARIL